MRLRLLLVAVLATVVLLAPAAGRAGAVSRDFFGVISVESPSGNEYETMGRGKVGTLRVILSWPNVEPSRGQRNWAGYDEIIGNATAKGINVLVTLYASPSFASPRQTSPPLKKAARRAWASFVADAVNRYRAGGAFWQSPAWNTIAANNPGAQPGSVTNWQVWNEVNSPDYWLKKIRVSSYARFLKLTGGVIHRTDPEAQVIVAGMFTRPSQRRSIALLPYLDQLYGVGGIKKFFDALAVHPYAKQPSIAVKTVKAVRRLTKKHGDGASPIWVTEMGWASSGKKSRYTTSPAGQASKLEASFGSLAASAERLGIAGVIWYAFRDVSPLGDWLYRTGLFEFNSTPKPAWSSFVRFTGGQP
jgi:hypothetical protein